MTLEQLRIFVAVAEREHVMRAASPRRFLMLRHKERYVGRAAQAFRALLDEKTLANTREQPAS